MWIKTLGGEFFLSSTFWFFIGFNLWTCCYSFSYLKTEIKPHLPPGSPLAVIQYLAPLSSRNHKILVCVCCPHCLMPQNMFSFFKHLCLSLWETTKSLTISSYYHAWATLPLPVSWILLVFFTPSFLNSPPISFILRVLITTGKLMIFQIFISSPRRLPNTS